MAAAAEAAGVSERTAFKWVDRCRREGEAGLLDRSSAPHRQPNRTAGEREELIVLLRELRFTGPEIAETIGMPCSTVSAILTRRGLGRLRKLTAPTLSPSAAMNAPGPGSCCTSMSRKLGKIGRPGKRVNGDPRTRTRGIGWEFVHVAVDDATRLAYVEVLVV